MENKWELILHDGVEDPYYELTNGPISLCANCGFVGENEEDEDVIFTKVLDALNNSGIDFHSENKLEFEQNVKIMGLEYEIDEWKVKYDDLQNQLQHKDFCIQQLQELVDADKVHYAQLKDKADKMEAELRAWIEIDNMNKGDSFIKGFELQTKALKLTDEAMAWNGKDTVCSCSLQQLAAHGECYKCPGQHTRHEITNQTK